MILAPLGRNDFRVAVICALPLEAEMLKLVLDADWEAEGKRYGKAQHDQNVYTTGALGAHNIVLAHMPDMGSDSAAAVSRGIKHSFPNIDIAFVVGICGVIPFYGKDERELILGDCVIGTQLVRYHSGRQYPGHFIPRSGPIDCLNGAKPEIRGLVRKLQSTISVQSIALRAKEILEEVQKIHVRTKKPETIRDQLFEATCLHTHPEVGQRCEKCLPIGICTLDCDAIACDKGRTISRKRHSAIKGSTPDVPEIIFGRFGSANTVMKSGADRDRIAAENDLLAFEMEVGGTIDNMPTIMVKAACDYADSHKNKDWQDYAAIAAAACLKGLLEQWELGTSDTVKVNLPSKVANYVSRPTLMVHIEDWLFDDRNDKPLALLGMGGAGKTQLALDCCKRAAETARFSSIIWLDATDPDTMRRSLRIALSSLVGHKDIAEEQDRNILQLTNELQRRGSRWLVVIDNFNDPSAFAEHPISYYYPKAENGRVLFTSRHRGVERYGNVIEITAMTPEESLQVLLFRQPKNDVERREGMKIVVELGYLPLPLDLAGSYIRDRGIDIGNFLEHYRCRKKYILTQLPDGWEYRKAAKGTDKRILLNVFTTCELSFEQVSGDETIKKAKARFLAVIAYFDQNSIRSTFLKEYCSNIPGGWTALFCTDGIWNENHFLDSVAELRRLSLVQTCMDPSMKGFTLHPIIREWLRLRGSPDECRLAIEECTAIIGNYLERFEILKLDLVLKTLVVANIDSCLQNDGRFRGEHLNSSIFPSLITYNFCDALQCTGRLIDAMELGERSLALIAGHSRDNSGLWYQMSRKVIDINKSLGNHKKILEAEQKHFEMVVTKYGLASKEAAWELQNLASIHRVLSNIDEAMELGQKALKLAREHCTKGDLTTTFSLRTLAAIYIDLEQYARAESLCLEALAGFRVLFGRLDPNTLMTAVCLGSVYSGLLRFSEAEEILTQTADNCEQELGLYHPCTFEAKIGIARAYVESEKLEEAEILLRAMLADQEQHHTSQDQEATIRFAFAKCMSKKGNYTESQASWLHALTYNEAKFGSSHRDTLRSASGLFSAQASLAVEKFAESDFETGDRLMHEALATRCIWFQDDDAKAIETINLMAYMRALAIAENMSNSPDTSRENVDRKRSQRDRSRPNPQPNDEDATLMENLIAGMQLLLAEEDASIPLDTSRDDIDHK